MSLSGVRTGRAQRHGDMKVHVHSFKEAALYLFGRNNGPGTRDEATEEATMAEAYRFWVIY